MMKRKREIVGVVVLLVSVCVSGGAQGRPPEKPQGGTIVEGLQLTLSAEETQVQVGQPFLLQVGIRNCTPKAVDLRYTGSMTTYVFEVRRSDGSEVPLTSDGKGLEDMRRSASNFGMIVEAGETCWAELDLARWYELASAGALTVVATRSIPRGTEAMRATVRSNTLSLSVRQ